MFKATYLRSASFAAISALPVILGCAQANAATFDFTMNVSTRGIITGEIDGLPNSGTGAATAVIINTAQPLPATGNANFPNAFPVGQNVVASPWTVSANSFTVSGDTITATNFLSQLGPTTFPPPAFVCFNTNGGCGSSSSLNVGNGPNVMATIGDGIGAGGFANLSATPTFTFVPSPPPPPVIPLPATLPLFASGLGALGLCGWRRKRRTQAVA